MQHIFKIMAYGVGVMLPSVLFAQVGTITPTDTSTTTRHSTDAPATQIDTAQTTTTQTSPQPTAGAVATERVARCIAQVDEIMARAGGDTLSQCTATLVRMTETVGQRRAAETQAIAQSREKWDAIRATQLAQLRALAVTSTQQRAVEVFTNMMNRAVSARKQGVNTAIDAYYTAHERSVSARRNEASAALLRHEQTLAELGRSARMECAAAVEANTVRSTLLEKRQAAVRSLGSISACQNLEAVAESTMGDRAARAASIERSLAQFRTEAAAARAALRAAFGLPPEKGSF